MNFIGKFEFLTRISKIYLYDKFLEKFPDQIEKSDLKELTDFSPNMNNILPELDHFYNKVKPINVSYIEREEKDILNDSTLTYGETRWKAAIKILKTLNVNNDDVFYDLGCGSGKLVFLVNQKFGIKSIGIDVIENFIKIAKIIVRKLDLEKIKFINGDFLKRNISDGTIFYITGTCFNDEIIDRLISKFTKIKKGSKVVIITRQLECKHLKLYKSLELGFGWAMDTAYFYKKV